jgi:hypothetical protein
MSATALAATLSGMRCYRRYDAMRSFKRYDTIRCGILIRTRHERRNDAVRRATPVLQVRRPKRFRASFVGQAFAWNKYDE